MLTIVSSQQEDVNNSTVSVALEMELKDSRIGMERLIQLLHVAVHLVFAKN